MRKTTIVLPVAILLVLWVANRAEAALQIRLSADGGTTWTPVTDDGWGDKDTVTTGRIVLDTAVIPTVGSFTLLGGTATSTDGSSLGSLSSVSISFTGGGGTLIVEVTDTFSITSGPAIVYFDSIYNNNLGGSASAVLTSVIDPDSTAWGPYNGDPNTGNNEWLPTITATAGQSGTQTGIDQPYDVGSLPYDFSLTQYMAITLTGAGAGILTYETTAYNPEPASLVAWSLLSGAAGLGWLRRRRRAA